MKALVSGLDYFLSLDRSTDEVKQLLNKVKLEGSLFRLNMAEDLGKKVTVLHELSTDNHDGLDVLFDRKKGVLGFEGIVGVRFVFTEYALRSLKEQGQFSTRYDGTNCVDVFYK